MPKTDTVTIADLIEQLGDHRTRAGARRALMALDNCPVDPLLNVLRDASAPVNKRWSVITVLAAAGVQEAVPVLLEVMKTESNLIDESATALRAITGLDCGQMVEDWESELGRSEDRSGKGDPGRNTLMSLVSAAVEEMADRIEWEADGYVSTEILVGDRKQQVLVAPGEIVGLEPGDLMVYTECGTVADLTREELEARLPTPRIGELDLTAVNGGVSLSLRHVVPMQDLDASQLRPLILAMAEFSDSLEENLTDQDRV